jgi:hypothetical protein
LQVSGGPLAAAGTNIAASSGMLSPIDASLRSSSGELTHTSPKAPSAGTVRFDFNYTAPSAQGAVTLYANGNSVNLSGNNSGDQWNFASNLPVSVSPTTSVEADALPFEFGLAQNFPNPFNPSTRIDYSLATTSRVIVKVYDASGREVATLVNQIQNPGYRSLKWTAGGLASGVYLYKMEAYPTDGGSAFDASKKLILMK